MSLPECVGTLLDSLDLSGHTLIWSFKSSEERTVFHFEWTLKRPPSCSQTNKGHKDQQTGEPVIGQEQPQTSLRQIKYKSPSAKRRDMKRLEEYKQRKLNKSNTQEKVGQPKSQEVQPQEQREVIKEDNTIGVKTKQSSQSSEMNIDLTTQNTPLRENVNNSSKKVETKSNFKEQSVILDNPILVKLKSTKTFSPRRRWNGNIPNTKDVRKTLEQYGEVIYVDWDHIMESGEALIKTNKELPSKSVNISDTSMDLTMKIAEKN